MITRPPLKTPAQRPQMDHLSVTRIWPQSLLGIDNPRLMLAYGEQQ